MKILVTGSNGMLGSAVCYYFEKQNYEVIKLNKKLFDLRKKNFIDVLKKKSNRADLIIHCAAYTDVNKAEIKKKELFQINVKSLKKICNFCNKTNTNLLYPQTFMILRSKLGFHNDISKDYEPIGSYAKSKFEAEKVIVSTMKKGNYKILRLGGFFGGGRSKDKNFVGIFLKSILPKAKKSGKLRIHIGDREWQPTYTLDIARAMEISLSTNKTYLQYASKNQVSFYILAKNISKIIDEKKIDIVKMSKYKIVEIAKRPENVFIKSSTIFEEKSINYSYLPRLKKYLKTEW